MKIKHNFIVAMICFGLLLFEITTYPSILTHPYMKVLIFTLFGVGGYHFGIGIGKTINRISS